MSADRSTHILETALQRFTLHGLQTPTADIAFYAQVGVGTLFRTFPSKEVLLEATYDFAVAQLAAPLQGGVGEAQRAESLQQQLRRWWTLTAHAALANPPAFSMWRLYRTNPQTAIYPEPLLGPFAPVPAFVERALARSAPSSNSAVLVRILGASLAAHWTASVEVVLGEPAAQVDPALAAQLLEQAYAAWWQSLGLSSLLAADWQLAAPVARPAPATPLWATLLTSALKAYAPTPAPTPTPQVAALGTGPANGLPERK
ncbi:MAG: TetR/AcrR family transcriptional regulator [Janthinobacterium lividum]